MMPGLDIRDRVPFGLLMHWNGIRTVNVRVMKDASKITPLMLHIVSSDKGPPPTFWARSPAIHNARITTGYTRSCTTNFVTGSSFSKRHDSRNMSRSNVKTDNACSMALAGCGNSMLNWRMAPKACMIMTTWPTVINIVSIVSRCFSALPFKNMNTGTTSKTMPNPMYTFKRISPGSQMVHSPLPFLKWLGWQLLHDFPSRPFAQLPILPSGHSMIFRQR